MKRSFAASPIEEQPEQVTPAQREWLERATALNSLNPEVEDWSFLKFFVQDPEKTLEPPKPDKPD
jgi:hypothetical protein